MSFEADIRKWSDGTLKRATVVYRRSVEKMAAEMAKTRPQGGRVPFLTGNLARSLQASTEKMPATSNAPSVGSNVGIVTADLKLGQAVWLGYQATYARRLEYGFIGADSLGRVYSQAGAHFVHGAIAEWPRFVRESVDEVRA